MSDEALVVDSTAFEKGARVEIVAPSRDISGNKLYPLVPGELYLLISMKGQGGKLGFPGSDLSHIGDKFGPAQFLYVVQQHDPSEVAGLAVFHTHANKLPKAGNPGEQLVLALVDSLDGAAPDDSLRTAAFLKTMRPPEFGEMETSQSYADNGLTRRMRSMAAAAPNPYVKAKILQVLMNWHVLGVEGPFVRAVAKAGATEAWAFTDPRDELWVDLGFGGTRPGYLPDLPGGNFCVDAIVNSKSPAVRYFFAAHMFNKMDATDLALLVPVLESGSNQLQEVLLGLFAARSGEKNYAPQFEIANGRRQVKDKDALIGHWKARFAAPPP